jgi:hypothetical protein
MVAGSFLFTFGVLGLGWMTFVGGGQRVSADPSYATAVPSLTARPTAGHTTHAPTAPPAEASDRPGERPSERPSAGASPSATASPNSTPSTRPVYIQTYVLVGGAYTSTEIPDGASISPSGDGVALVTDPDTADRLRVVYTLDDTELPAGADVVAVAVRVCGSATGASYEIDGPLGTSQSIRVATPPESDGCWHLDAQAPEDLSVTLSVGGGSELRVSSVEYEVSLAR